MTKESATEKQPYSQEKYMLRQRTRELERELQVYKCEREQVVQKTYVDNIAMQITHFGQDILYTLVSCLNVALEKNSLDSIPMVNIGGVILVS